MGSAYAAACKCEYEAPECPISSTRAQHGRQWWYPYACDTCRTVVSIDLLSDNHSCPQCGNEDVLGEQRMLATAQAQGQHYTSTRFRSFADADTGARIVKQVPVRIKPRFWTGARGECLLAISVVRKQMQKVSASFHPRHLHC